MNELQITSIHEAGHAVTALRLGLVFDHVTAVPDDYAETDGALHWTELHTADGLEISPELDAVVLLAGPFAEAKLLRISLDEVLADEAAGEDREALATLGLSDAQFISASREALAMIEREWPAIERVARELQDGPLSFEDVTALASRG
jgi:hypothetical protein